MEREGRTRPGATVAPTAARWRARFLESTCLAGRRAQCFACGTHAQVAQSNRHRGRCAVAPHCRPRRKANRRSGPTVERRV